jgi:hypothetical protein
MARKRELIEPHAGDKRYTRRGESGRFDETEDMGRSLTRDRKRRARGGARRGQGDRGDRSS